jgi:nucleoid DNA-binding protein
MDKPISMSVKDFLVRTLAVKMMMSEKMIEAVVNHQFQSANEAMDLNNSLEISGFGKFYFNEKKAVKRLGQLNAKKQAMERIIIDETTSEQKKRSSKVTLEKTEALINLLTTKTIYEDQLLSDIRGVEEQHLSS